MRSGAIIAATMVAFSCAAVPDAATNSVDASIQRTAYLDLPPPGVEPEVFAPGIVSTEGQSELNAVLSPDGKEFYFARQVGETYKTFIIRKTDIGWSAPEMASFSASNSEWDEVDVWFDKSGDVLYYVSNAPVSGFDMSAVNIWRVYRKDDGDWGEPEALPAPINTDGAELYPMPTISGAFYFSSTREGGFGERDIYLAQENDGVFFDVKNLGPAINTEAREGDVYVAPDETFMIVTSEREGGVGRADLYLSKRQKDGGWSELVNLGAPVNSEYHDYTPVMSADGRLFFFTRGGDVYWVDAAHIWDQLKASE